MNVKLKLFDELFKQKVLHPTKDFDQKLFLLFEEFTEEEKIFALNGRPERSIIEFLQVWYDGILIELDSNELKNLQIFEDSNRTRCIGGQNKALRFIRSSLSESISNRFHEKPIRIKTEEELYPSFLQLNYFPIESVIHLLKKEDPQTVSVVLDTIKRNELTRNLYEKLNPVFEGKLFEIQRVVQKSIIREIERVLERKLYMMHEN
ncbi:hypothetical protein [Leptospira levettii]|uniref:hypothetical protein n=1 Tax=Leptospira levettii TaxID=2023178 RepID=UPI003EBFFD7A